MTRKAENLLKKLENAMYNSITLAKEVQRNGGMATGELAEKFIAANKEVVRVQKELLKAYENNLITLEEYRIIKIR